MATAQHLVVEGDVCPDPSAHTHHPGRLQDQASKAALHVTQPEKPEKVLEPERSPPLGPDGKLSSAGAATSLKHAKPHELPSHPITGIDTTQSGNTAAQLATNTHKPFEHWKPELSSSAGKAALLAHRDGGKLDLWSPSSSDTGHTAAGMAMGKQSNLAPHVDHGVTDDGRRKALKAATHSVSSRPRDRALSTPTPAPSYPDAENAGFNALNAAAVAHRPVARSSHETPRVSSPANEAARLTHMKGDINRDMFSEHPPIGMGARQSHALKGASLAASRSARSSTDTDRPSSQALMNAKSYARVDLQEQAQKLAQERLAKLDPDGVTAYREHYGYTSGGEKRSRLSVRHRRARSSSGGTSRNKRDEDDDDAATAGRIRHQMSRFNEQVASVDAQKRKTDRDTLMAAAEKSVRQRMSTLDQRIFDETGKVSPAMMEQWETKARERAAASSEKRMEHHGKVDVGGGKFMDQSEVERIAASRMQPTLDEIEKNAEKQRARDEEVRLDQERRREEATVEKQRDRETKAELKKARHEEKEAAKADRRAQKEEAKQAKAADKEQARMKRESEEQDSAAKTSTEEGDSHGKVGGFGKTDTTTSKRPLNKLTKGEKAAMEPSAEDPPGVPTSFDGSPSRGYQHDEQDLHMQKEASGQSAQSPTDHIEEIQTAEGPMIKRNTKRDSRVRSWLSKLKRSGKHTRSSEDTERTEGGSVGKVGGEHGLYSHYQEATREEEEDVVVDGKPKPSGEEHEREDLDESKNLGGNMEKYLGKEKGEEPASASISSPSMRSSAEIPKSKVGESSVGDDEFEEAKDKFDDEALKTPPEIRIGGRREPSPSKSGSKFTEEL